MSKKGSTFDAIAALLALSIFIGAALIGHVIYNQVVSTGSLNGSNYSVAILAQGTQYYTTTADNVGFGIYMGSVLMAVALAYIFGQNPLFKFIAILLDMLFLIFSVIIATWWDSFSTNSNFSTVTTYYPKIFFLLDHSVLMTLLTITIISIALYASGKRRTSI